MHHDLPRLVPCLALVVCLASCSSPYATQLPTEVVTWDGDAKLQKTLAQLDQEERALLERYTDRKAREGSVGGEGIRPGTTVYVALDDQRSWEVEQALLEAEQQAVAERHEAQRQDKIEEMRQIASATITQVSLEPADVSRSRLTDMFEAKITIRNLSDQALSKVKGKLVLRDSEGEQLKSVLLIHGEGISPKSEVTIEAQLQHSSLAEGDVKLAKTPLDQLTVGWEPILVVLADGSRVGAE